MNQTEPQKKEFPQKLLESLFVALQYLLPHHVLSSLMHRLTRIESTLIKDLIIRTVVDVYRVNMQEAMQSDPSRYRSFNDFFTRALRPDARPVTQQPNEIACPADGTLSQAGDIESGYLFQAKGHDYALFELLGGDQEMTAQFEDGHFATIYLSPKDYHRLHMPLAGKLRKMVHVPGRLFSVNETTCRKVPRLFARNERVICLFDTEVGPMAMILVGAIFVSSIETVWAGTVTPTRLRVSSWDYNQPHQPDLVQLEKGEEMGRFNMGSTVILLFGKDAVEWTENLLPGAPLKMGTPIAELT